MSQTPPPQQDDKILNFFKEHLSVFLIIPTVLGGFYQITNILLVLGFPYIRYFSVSQVIPDGLLIISFIFFIGLMLLMIRMFINDFVYKMNPNNGNILRFFTFNLLIILTISFYTIGAFIDLLENIPTTISEVLFLYFVFFFILVLFNAWVKLFFETYIYLKNITDQIKIKKYKSIYTKYFILTLFILFLFLLPSQIENINNIIINSNLYNYEIILNKIEHSYNLDKSPEVLYINKDYIFINVNINNRNTILLVETKTLTDNILEKK